MLGLAFMTMTRSPCTYAYPLQFRCYNSASTLQVQEPVKGAPKAVKRRPKKPAQTGSKLASVQLYTLLCHPGQSSVRFCSLHMFMDAIPSATCQEACAASQMVSCLQQLLQDRRGETSQLAARSGAVGARRTTVVMMKGQRGTRKVQSPVHTLQLPILLQVGILIQASFTPPYHPWQSFS